MVQSLAEAMLRFTERQGGESPFATPIEDVGVLRSDLPNPPAHRLSRPSLCIVAQGAKWASFGGDRLEYRAGQALVVGVDAPSVGRVFEASPGKPCLVLLIALDLAVLRSVAETLDPQPKPTAAPGRGAFVVDLEGPLADCALRLMQLCDKPSAIAALWPGLKREIAYWLLAGPQGSDVARLALANTPSDRVMTAVQALRARFAEPIRVEELARAAGMSLSAFHRQFKALTALSPLQYQKQLRLLEGRRLMVSGGLNVESAAFAVGYESPSQFNREYARLFGSPPKRDVGRLRTLLDEQRAAEAPELAA